jgi:hypothetical protein
MLVQDGWRGAGAFERVRMTARATVVGDGGFTRFDQRGVGKIFVGRRRRGSDAK